MIDIFSYFIYISLLLTLVFFLMLKIRISKSSLSIKIHAFNSNDIDSFLQPNRLKINHFFALILISFIVGFRYHVGNDWQGYKETFEIIKLNKSFSFQDQYMEWGFFMINFIIARLGGHYTLMFFVIALISWYFIFKSVPATLLPLVLYFLFTNEFFFWSMNGIRQFVAIGIFLYSIKYIIKRNLIVFILLIIFASLFHISILFVAPLYFIPFQKLYNQTFWVITFLVSFIFANVPLLISVIRNTFMFFADKIPILSIYLRYFDNGQYEAQNLVVGLGYLFRQIVTIIILLFSKSVINKYPQTKIYFVLYFLGSIIFNMFYMFQLIDRFNIYFLILHSIVVSIIVSHLWKNKRYKIVSIGLVTLYFILYLSTIYNSSNMCSPYRFDFMRF